MNTLRKRSLQKSGMPPLLKGLFIVAGVVVVGIPVVFILSMYLWVNEVFSNDEVATRVASVAVLDGQRHLTLYRQKMWDAVLWRVVETSEAAAKEIPALHASVDSSGEGRRSRSDDAFGHR